MSVHTLAPAVLPIFEVQLEIHSFPVYEAWTRFLFNFLC